MQPNTIYDDLKNVLFKMMQSKANGNRKKKKPWKCEIQRKSVKDIKQLWRNGLLFRWERISILFFFFGQYMITLIYFKSLFASAVLDSQGDLVCHFYHPG